MTPSSETLSLTTIFPISVLLPLACVSYQQGEAAGRQTSAATVDDPVS
jgi:hypothetical protein